MQTTLPRFEFDVLCVDGPLSGQLFADGSHHLGGVYRLGLAEIPYRIEQTELGEWVYVHAADLDPSEQA